MNWYPIRTDAYHVWRQREALPIPYFCRGKKKACEKVSISHYQHRQMMPWPCWIFCPTVTDRQTWPIKSDGLWRVTSERQEAKRRLFSTSPRTRCAPSRSMVEYTRGFEIAYRVSKKMTRNERLLENGLRYGSPRRFARGVVVGRPSPRKCCVYSLFEAFYVQKRVGHDFEQSCLSVLLVCTRYLLNDEEVFLFFFIR